MYIIKKIIASTDKGGMKPLKPLESKFSSIEEAESFIKENILPLETTEYITFNLQVTKEVKIREYMFKDSNDNYIYSYRIMPEI